MTPPPVTGGFEPRTDPAERRALFDILRRLREAEAKIEDLLQRVEVLEP